MSEEIKNMLNLVYKADKQLNKITDKIMKTDKPNEENYKDWLKAFFDFIYVTSTVTDSLNTIFIIEGEMNKDE